MDISIKDLVITDGTMQILPIQQLIPMQWIGGEVWWFERFIYSHKNRCNTGEGNGHYMRFQRANGDSKLIILGFANGIETRNVGSSCW